MGVCQNCFYDFPPEELNEMGFCPDCAALIFEASLMGSEPSSGSGVEVDCPYCHGTDLDMDGDSGGGCTHCFNGKVAL